MNSCGSINLSPLNPREGFCSFLDKRTKIKTAETPLFRTAAFAANRAEAQATNLLPYFVPTFLCFSKILKALPPRKGRHLPSDLARGWSAVERGSRFKPV